MVGARSGTSANSAYERLADVDNLLKLGPDLVAFSYRVGGQPAHVCRSAFAPSTLRRTTFARVPAAKVGGRQEDRTPGLGVANAALSQLS